MKRNLMGKFYLLYSNKNQEKFLSMADDIEILKERTEYYNSGVWFSYDMKEGSNLLENEKEMKGIKFPKEPKIRERLDLSEERKHNFKWVS